MRKTTVTGGLDNLVLCAWLSERDEGDLSFDILLSLASSGGLVQVGRNLLHIMFSVEFGLHTTHLYFNFSTRFVRVFPAYYLDLSKIFENLLVLYNRKAEIVLSPQCLSVILYVSYRNVFFILLMGK